MPREPITILLDDVADAMDRSPEDPHEPLLDRHAGSVVYAPDPDSVEIWDQELARALDDEPERFLLIPRVESREEYSWMASFVETLANEDGDARDRLADALAGKGAFGRFRAVLRDYPSLRERWFAARTEHLVDETTAWLEREKVAFVPHRRRVERPHAQQTKGKEKLPLGIVHVLLLGAGDRAVVDGKVRRVLVAGSRKPRELFKLLARDLCAMNGVEWRNRFIEGKSEFELAGTRVSYDEASVHVDVEIPEGVRELFERRRDGPNTGTRD